MDSETMHAIAHLATGAAIILLASTQLPSPRKALYRARHRRYVRVEAIPQTSGPPEVRVRHLGPVRGWLRKARRRRAWRHRS